MTDLIKTIQKHKGRILIEVQTLTGSGYMQVQVVKSDLINQLCNLKTPDDHYFAQKIFGDLIVGPR